jgi:antitoxin (DNA-binding transcriptional repressor) of toxin-antitoxin stability system
MPHQLAGLKEARMDVTVDPTISADDLARGLPEVLDRVKNHGERFTIERDGEPVALLTPPDRKRFTVAGFLALWEHIPHPDDAFADDVEAMQAAQGRSEPPEGPS